MVNYNYSAIGCAKSKGPHQENAGCPSNGLQENHQVSRDVSGKRSSAGLVPQRFSFHLIPPLLDRIKEVDPDVVVDCGTMEGTTIFERVFIFPSAIHRAFQFYQLLIGRVSQKKVPNANFLASVLDGNMEVLILCYALAPIKNTENWAWFLRLLLGSMHGVDMLNLPFVLDRQ